jgi:PAS domain S-box-containing protein
MKRRSECGIEHPHLLREKILGFGETSFRKSYYPELRVRLLELERFRFTLDQINVGIMILNSRDGIIVDLNEETCTILGGRREELIGVKFQDSSEVAARMYEEMGRGDEGVAIYEGIHPSAGSPYSIEITTHQAIFGEEEYRIVIIRDITSQRSAGQALIRTRNLFEAIIRMSHMQDASEKSILSSALRIAVSITQSSNGMCGVISPDKRFFTIYSYRNGGEVTDTISPFGKNGPWESIIRGDEWIWQPIGQRLDLPITEGDQIVAIITLTEKKGRYSDLDLRQITYLGNALWQIILRHRAEDGLLRLNEELEGRVERRTLELEAANRELEAFTYSVSHDLRTPLRAVDGFSLALLEDFGEMLPAEAEQYLKRIRLASQRMGDLIDDLLLLSRISRAELSRGTFSLSDLALEVVAEIKLNNPGRSVAITIEENMVVSADRRLIRIVLENLFGNAWKFTLKKEKADITFRSQSNGITTTYILSDNGAGFDMTYARKLFIPFSRLHTSEEFSGTGIGLATVSRIIQKHGGSIRAEGVPGRGATFYFTLGSNRKYPEERSRDDERNNPAC